MKLNQVLLIILSIFLILMAINTVDAAQIDDNIASSNENIISSTNMDKYTSSGPTHTFELAGSSVYIKDYNPKYKLSNKAKKQFNSVKKAPKKIYTLTIDDTTYSSLLNAKKTNTDDYYTFDTDYTCKVLKPVFKTKNIKKTIINKKYPDRQKYFNAYNKYFTKYNHGKYNMDVNFHFYKGTNNIKYATIKVTKKVKQVTLSKFKTDYTNIKADIGYNSHEGQLGKGSYLFFYGKTLGYEFSEYVANKRNII